MKKKVLFLGRFPPPTHGASIMNELYFNGKEMNENFELKKIKINYFNNLDQMGSLSLRKFFGVFIVFFKLLKELIVFKPDLIYFEIPVKGLAFIRDSLFVLECKIFKKKIIFQTHTKGLKFSKYAKFVFGDSKMIILSPLLYNEVSNIFDEKHVYFVPNGIKDQLDNRGFKEILKKRKNKEYNLLFLSNMYETKGPLDALKICNYLKDQIKFKCFFVGNFPDRGIEKKWYSLREEYHLEKECVYLGPKYGKDKEEILEKTNFLIFPTQYENESFPVVILESLMFGIPVLSYDTGAIREIISQDYLGYISERGDWRALAEILKKRIKQKIDYNKIRNYFKRYYQFEISESKLIEIFNKEI
jgi:glycosyltransferase involved in cell wall biosynthesis